MDAVKTKEVVLETLRDHASPLDLSTGRELTGTLTNVMNKAFLQLRDDMVSKHLLEAHTTLTACEGSEVRFSKIEIFIRFTKADSVPATAPVPATEPWRE